MLREQPPPFPSLPSFCPGDLSLPRLQADRDVWRPEKWENNSLTVPVPLFASSLGPAGLSAWAMSCWAAGLGCAGPSLRRAAGWVLSLCWYEETRAFTLSFWPTWGRLDFWKAACLHFTTHNFFLFLLCRLQHNELNIQKKRLLTFFAAFNGAARASNQRARQRHACSLPAINSQTQTLHRVEGCIINKRGCYHVTILKPIY